MNSGAVTSVSQYFAWFVLSAVGYLEQSRLAGACKLHGQRPPLSSRTIPRFMVGSLGTLDSGHSLGERKAAAQRPKSHVVFEKPL